MKYNSYILHELSIKLSFLFHVARIQSIMTQSGGMFKQTNKKIAGINTMVLLQSTTKQARHTLYLYIADDFLLIYNGVFRAMM